MTIPTPSQRFKVQGVKLDMPRGSEGFRLLDLAQQVDGFPHSYPAEALPLARDVIRSIAEVGLDAQAIAVLREVAKVCGR